MNILAVDLLNLFRRNWEAPSGNTSGVALLRTRNAIRSFRKGFDVVAICSDAAPMARSFRTTIEPSYKRTRTVLGWEYASAVRAALTQLADAGHRTFVATADGGGGDRPTYYEAEDVIASLCAWALLRGHRVRIVSSDKDLMQLVVASEPRGHRVDILRPDGGVLDHVAIAQKLGVAPCYVPDWLALAGDASDGYKPFPGPVGENGKRKQGIGDKTAVGLIKDVLADEQWRAGERGSHPAFAVFDLLGLDELDEAVGNGSKPPRLTCGPATKRILKAHGVQAAGKGLALATLRRDVPLDFSVLETRT